MSKWTHFNEPGRNAGLQDVKKGDVVPQPEGGWPTPRARRMGTQLSPLDWKARKAKNRAAAVGGDEESQAPETAKAP